MKVVQQLLINGAEINLKSQKTQKVAKDSTKNQRIVYLIEKYEKLRLLERCSEDGSSDATSSGSDEE